MANRARSKNTLTGLKAGMVHSQVSPPTPWDKLKLRVRRWQRLQTQDEEDFKKDHLDAYEDLSHIVKDSGFTKGV